MAFKIMFETCVPVQDSDSRTPLLLECNFNSRLSIGYHQFTWLFSTFIYNTDYENPGVVLPASK